MNKYINEIKRKKGKMNRGGKGAKEESVQNDTGGKRNKQANKAMRLSAFAPSTLHPGRLLVLRC
jgi:hypothetical protein